MPNQPDPLAPPLTDPRVARTDGRYLADRTKNDLASRADAPGTYPIQLIGGGNTQDQSAALINLDGGGDPSKAGIVDSRLYPLDPKILALTQNNAGALARRNASIAMANDAANQKFSRIGSRQ